MSSIDALSDAELLDAAARRLAVPRRDPADSFVLHAPLELLARSALLQRATPARRDEIRRRMVWVADTYDASGPPAEDARGGPVPDLRAAIDAGDLEGVDRAAIDLVGRTSAGELVDRLADLVVPRLSAAAHGSIFLYQLPRLAAASAPAAMMVRGLLREVAREPAWRVEWIERRRPQRRPSGADLAARLLDPPSPGDPGSPFIHPMMSLVDRSGLAAALLDDTTAGMSVPEARRVLLRVAAHAMLQDDPQHAPYGWSHCLTLPQAVLGVADRCRDPHAAVAVAATHVLGFRAIQGRVRLDLSWQPPPGRATPAGFLDDGPDRAASALWHASPERRPAFLRELAAFAATHADAHLAKYTLACVEAGRDDPEAAPLFHAAAAFLAGWWAARQPARPRRPLRLVS